MKFGFETLKYWGLGIGASIASRTPILGAALVKLIIGGPIIAGATLSRFFALHVFVIPGLLIFLVSLHLLMVVKLGINEWPMPGRVVRKATYEKRYHELTKKDGAPFVPYAVWKDMFFAGTVVLAIVICAALFGPFGPTGQPDPTIIQTVPKPDYFFLWLYALLALLPPSLETVAVLLGPAVVIGALLLLPFLSGEGEKSWRRRHIAVMSIMLIAVTLGSPSVTPLLRMYAVRRETSPARGSVRNVAMTKRPSGNASIGPRSPGTFTLPRLKPVALM